MPLCALSKIPLPLSSLESQHCGASNISQVTLHGYLSHQCIAYSPLHNSNQDPGELCLQESGWSVLRPGPVELSEASA